MTVDTLLDGAKCTNQGPVYHEKQLNSFCKAYVFNLGPDSFFTAASPQNVENEER